MISRQESYDFGGGIAARVEGSAEPSLKVTNSIPKTMSADPANQLTGTFSPKTTWPRIPLVKKLTAEDITTTMTVLFCSIAFRKYPTMNALQPTIPIRDNPLTK